VASLQKAGSTDTEKLIAAMEGLTFDTPKGAMTARRTIRRCRTCTTRIKKDAKDNDA
jgi:branched-chain amino acid transport system substrate-binding protein